MSSLNKVRLPDGTELAISEWLHWPLYSTVEFAAGSPVRLDAFTYVRGNRVPSSGIAGRNARRSDTNLVRAAKMNQDEALVVFSITYELFGLSDTEDVGGNTIAPAPLVDATDLRRLQRDLLVELLVGSGIKKPQIEAPFSWFSSGIGNEVFTSGDHAAIHLGQAGRPTPLNQSKLQLPVYIGGFGENAKPGNSMVFKLRTRSPAGPPANLTQNFRLRWWLDGLRKRPA